MTDQYYGVAWNHEDDSYALTGSLLNATRENVDEQMFVHNAIAFKCGETDDRCYELPNVYERQFQVGTTSIIEVAMTPLIGFSLCKVTDVVRILLLIEYGVWKAVKQQQ